MKAALSLGLLWILTGPDFARAVELHWHSPVKERIVTFYAEPQGTPPEQMTYLVEPNNPDPTFQSVWEREAQTNHNLIPKKHGNDAEIFVNQAKAIWVPFKTNLTVDLGPGNGGRTLWVSYRNKNDTGTGWDGTAIIVQSSPASIGITDPTERIISQPMIQLKGFTSRDLEKPVSYQIFDQSGSVTASGEGIVGDRYFDKTLWAFTTNYFQCYDLELNPGTNTIVIHAVDNCGFSITTNFTCVFTTAGVMNGPSLKPVWPKDNDTLTDSAFTMRGNSDDFTAHIVALIVSPDCGFQQKEAAVERNGRYWVDDIPLPEGRTYITLIANNAAGYTTVTNLSVRKGHGHLEMDPVVPASKLWLRYLTITGTSSFSPSNYTILANGVKATLFTNGNWKAENVPIPEGGVATFDMVAVPNSGHDEGSDPDPYPTAPITWGAPTNGIKWGIYLAPSDTNHMNRQHCEIYVVNESGTNMNFLWMRPKQQALYSLRLYDKDGKEMPKSYSGRAHFGAETASPPQASLDIHHLDAAAIAQIEGVLPLTTNAPVRVASFEVMDQYGQLASGDYRMQIAGRLYQIGNAGKLTLFEAAPMTLPLQNLEQPSEMVYHLRLLQSQGKFSWGESTNGLRAGIAHNFGPPSTLKGDEIEVFLMNDSTNDLHDLLLPAPEQQFELTLFDPLGKEVPKTAIGEQQGKPLTLAADASGITPVFIAGKDATKCGRFNLNAYFKIKTPGLYRLTYQQRIYQIGTTGLPVATILPVLTVPVEIQ